MVEIFLGTCGNSGLSGLYEGVSEKLVSELPIFSCKDYWEGLVESLVLGCMDYLVGLLESLFLSFILILFLGWLL